MPGRKFSGPLLPGTKSVRVYETKKARAARLKKMKYKSRSYKSSYKPTASFNNQMRKYNNINCEKKIMIMNNYLNGPASAGYLQDIPAGALNNAGLVNDALTCIVLQTGRQETTENATLPTGVVKLMDGYSNINGSVENRLIGQYAKLTSTYMNINITMDPLQDESSTDIFNAQLPHQFRLIQVKARRNKMVNPGLAVPNTGHPSLATNLFRNEEGNARGINSECATQDVFTWFVNKQFWIVLKDERFTLAAPTIVQSATENNRFIAPNVHEYKASRFKKYWLPKPKTKVIFRSHTVDGVAKNEIIDYDYVTHTIILCKNTSSGERPSNHWSVQANGATAFIDE